MGYFDKITFVIEKGDIEDMDFFPVTQYVMDYSANKQVLIDNHSRFDINIHGYDDDPRELFETVEVVNWVKKSIDEEIPWFYLLSPDIEAQGLRMLAACYCSIPVKGLDDCWFLTPDWNKLQEFLVVNFHILNTFMEKYELPETLNSEISEKLLAYFQYWTEKNAEKK